MSFLSIRDVQPADLFSDSEEGADGGEGADRDEGADRGRPRPRLAASRGAALAELGGP